MNRPKNSFRALSYTQQAQESLAATMSLSDIITSWADCYKTPNIELQTSNFEKISLETKNQKKATDEQTDGRTDGRTDWVTLSLLELLIAAKKIGKEDLEANPSGWYVC